MKNLEFNKKKIASLILASELILCPIEGTSSTTSTNSNTTSQEDYIETVRMAKITGNNVNIRSNPSTRSDIIGFADVTDYFEIIDEVDDWYQIKYLNTTAYVTKRYARETYIEKENLNFRSIVYLTCESTFYRDLSFNQYTTLPQYQNAFVISETSGYYKVMVDGVVGYIRKSDTRSLSNTCVIIDLSRQMLRVYKNTKEVGRYHIISGRESMQTRLGCFRIGHKLTDYQLTPDNFVHYWIQYDGNIGIHDASWQKDSNYTYVTNHAYSRFGRGNGRCYPDKYGSHGCDNMRESDAREVYNLVHKNDNVLVIGPNNLIRLRLISDIINEYFLANSEYYFDYDEIDIPKIKKLV